MTQEEEIKRDLEKAAKISMRLCENVTKSIQKKLRKGDNIPRLTAMILQTTTSILMASFMSLHREVANMSEEMVKEMISKTVADALHMAGLGVVKAKAYSVN